jgi:hypothetical protein
MSALPPESGHRKRLLQYPLRAKSGHRACRLFGHLVGDDEQIFQFHRFIGATTANVAKESFTKILSAQFRARTDRAIRGGCH